MNEQAAPDFSRSRAVLIGTSDYTNLPPVPAAAHSLRRLHGLLTGPVCGWPADRTVRILNERLPGDLPDRLVDLYSDAADVALFYFVGHGQLDLRDRLCLGLTDTRETPERRATTSLTFDAVRDALGTSDARVKIVILDCCFSGRAITGTLGSDDVLEATRGTGAYTVAASGDYNTAWFETEPGARRPQTYFTKHLVDIVESGIAGAPAVLTLDTIVDHLTEDLAAHGKPVPKRRTLDFASRFPFARNVSAAEPPAEPPPVTRTAPVKRSRVSHPALLAALVAATVVTMVQLGQSAHELSVRLATGLSGLAAFAVVPAVVIAGLVASLRRRERNWSIGMAAALVVWLLLFGTANVGTDVGGTALVAFRTVGPDQPDDAAVFAVDLGVRLLAGSAGAFWYALRGPRWRAPPRGLLYAAVGAAAVALLGVLVLSASVGDERHAYFDLFGAARVVEASDAVVGIGNVMRSDLNEIDPGGAVWSLGWLALVTIAVVATVGAFARRQPRWAAGLLTSVIVSAGVGLTAVGLHEGQAGVRGLGLLLAAMTITAGGVVVAYAWRVRG